MNLTRMDALTQLLHTEVIPATGCTEPAAVALCAAYAAQALEGHVEQLRYIYKNGMNVGIPGTNRSVGLPIAAALGAVSANPAAQLEVLQSLSFDQLGRARTMVAEGGVTVEASDTPEKIYVSVQAEGNGHIACAVISGSHTHLTRLLLDGQTLQCCRVQCTTAAKEEQAFTLDDLFDYVDVCKLEEIAFLRECETLNMAISQEGLATPYGHQVGRHQYQLMKDGLLSGDLVSKAVAETTAATDARMGGCELSVMTVGGSGNQGLTATIPILVAARELGISEEKKLRALVLSCLATLHAKRYIGRLSALCGCSIAAAVGICAGLTNMLNGSRAQAMSAIQTLVADLSGVICDGAKAGCSLKIATAVQSAGRAVLLALVNLSADGRDGIVAVTAETTLTNLRFLSEQGLNQANDAILTMMMRNAAM